MKSKTSMCAISAASVAIFAMVGFVRADGGDGGDVMFPVAYTVGDDQAAAPASCDEQREAARFETELKRTDGDVSPAVAEISCRDAIYAEAQAD